MTRLEDKSPPFSGSVPLRAGNINDLGASRTAEAEFSFDCPCSRERFRGHLASLDEVVAADILEKGPRPLETECHYCSMTYSFVRAEFERALLGGRRKKNMSTSAPQAEESRPK